MQEPSSQEPSSTTPTIPFIICPTTHNDWDWLMTFEQYYEQADNTYGVRGILNSVTTILEGVTNGNPASPNDDFRFSYAEVGFLRRYLNEFPDKAALLQNNKERFCLLGGGITSPDNQVSHCEAFIRNYLTGHEYLRSAGIIGNMFPVAWLPDDFGHSSQLPVLIRAMGMPAIGLSRIPGSPQPTPCSTQRADADARANGLTFYWSGNDGSRVLTHFMPETYYGITNGEDQMEMGNTQQCMKDFLDAAGSATWPGDIIFATQGGDWQFPTSSATGGTADGAYNWQGAIGATVSGGGVTATSQLGTFADYYNLLMEHRSEIPQFTLFAENYWTGYFASRPQLKIDHYRAVQRLLGAEVLEALFAVYGGTSSQEQTELAAAIAAAWELLVPTTHHDYITGTSQNSVYDQSTPRQPDELIWDSNGQLAMSDRAAKLASAALDLAMEQLARAAGLSQQNGIPVVVFNQTGRDLPDTAVVEIADPSGGKTNYEVQVGAARSTVQRSSDGTLLFQVPGMRSMAYQVVYLISTAAGTPATPSEPASGDYDFSNGVVDLTLSQSNGWAITVMTIGNNSYIGTDGTYANQIGLWRDYGNIYQFGMEYQSGCNTYGQVYAPPPDHDGFKFKEFLTGGTGTLVEQGPIRWRFIGDLTDSSGNSYTTQYDLIAGESLVRITTSGTAPGDASGQEGWSVLASFSMQTGSGATGSVLEYGTSYFWEDREPEASWDGLIFRATHDFAQLATGGGEAVAAVYHNGIPAWTIDGNILRGCLLRNTPGAGRGASGSDTASHTQQYTLDVLAQPAQTGYPLRTALYAQTPLHAVRVDLNHPATMPDEAQLASVAQPDAVLCAGKLGVPSGDGRSLILRVQQSRTNKQLLDITVPFRASNGGGTPEIVTALETPAENPPGIHVRGTMLSFMADRALWTMKVPFGANRTE